MEKLISLFSVLCDKTRIRIIKLLSKKMCTMFELAEVFQMNDVELKPHIDALRHAGLVSEVKDGQFINYFVKGSGAIFDKYTSDVLNLVSKHFNSDETVLKDYTKARMIDRKELAKRKGII
ncbi:MAG: ArsR family transcriptional regulator [bacterium]|nr:ArsR family transcriptional regulator [bacterium]